MTTTNSMTLVKIRLFNEHWSILGKRYVFNKLFIVNILMDYQDMGKKQTKLTKLKNSFWIKSISWVTGSWSLEMFTPLV